MADFLLELRSEEIPARMQAGARKELEKLFRREMDAAGVAMGDVSVWSTPRRLALIARGLPTETKAVSEEAKGPPVGAPDQAVDGFCRKNDVTRDQLEVREVKGRETYFAVIDTPGRAVKDVLAAAIPAIIRDFAWPKSMRWGGASISTESMRWVRPLSGIVALLGTDIVECEVHLGGSPEKVESGFSPSDPTTKKLMSGAVTLGHRFHHSGDITIGDADDYAVKLRAGHVIVDHEERAALIRKGAAQVASEAGLNLVEDEGLVVENAGLTEWPIPLLGLFEEDFLTVPPETIQLTARVNQKYFVCEDSDGQLANAFICTANIEAEDGGAAIVDGNRKVLAARLSDARFFWDVDRKKTLAEHATKLDRITFHEKLGSVAYRAHRASGLAYFAMRNGWLPPVTDLVRDENDLEKIFLNAKADLVTEMVGEFPELQGTMGYYYAKSQGLPNAIADAIKSQYEPLGQDGATPTQPLSIIVALADKLQTLSGFYSVGIKPTGSKDPFALRRQALGAIRIILENELRIPLRELLLSEMLATFFAQVRIHAEREEIEANEAIEHVRAHLRDEVHAKKQIKDERFEKLVSEIMPKFDQTHQAGLDLLDFFADRLKVQQREAGVRHDLIDAVFALGGEDDLVRLLARVHALQSFMETEDGANLLAGYKRASNILKKEDWHGAETEIPQTGEEDPLALVDDPDMKDVVAAQIEERKNNLDGKSLSYTPEPAEKALIDALDTAEPKATTAIEAEDFEGAMSALATLRAPIDAFFDNVTVNDPDQAKRAARLGLLARFRAAVHNVADFSKIEG